MIVPDLVQAVVGYRVWNVVRGPVPLLASLNGHEEWAPGRAATASCFRRAGPLDTALRPHDAPDPSCTCGLYAAKSEDELLDPLNAQLAALVHAAPQMQLVRGEVAMWGRVVEHERGWRGALAYPLRVVVPADFRSVLVAEDRSGARRLAADEAAALIGRLYGCDTAVGRPGARRDD